jgi:hypothetical protein
MGVARRAHVTGRNSKSVTPIVPRARRSKAQRSGTMSDWQALDREALFLFWQGCHEETLLAELP